MPEVTVRHIQAGLRQETLPIPYWQVDSGTEGPVVLVVAAQHGNEVQGSEALRRFVLQAGQELQAGKVVGVPFCNLPALRERHHHQRQGSEEPVAQQPEHNMNLQWPGDADGNDTARIAHAVYSTLGESATHVVDIHCWTRFWAAACLPRSDRPRSLELAAVSALPFARTNPGRAVAPGTTLIGTYFGDTGRVSLTFELAGQYVIYEPQVALASRCLSNVARFLGMMPGEPEGTDEGPTWRHEAELVDIVAPGHGLFVEAQLLPGDWVQEGQYLGHLLSDDDLSATELHAAQAGRLEAYGCHRPNCDVSLAAMHPYATEGDLLARIVVPRT